MRRNIVEELERVQLREAEERASHPARRSRRHLNRALRKARRAVARGAERNPDERPAIDSLDDWILSARGCTEVDALRSKRSRPA